MPGNGATGAAALSSMPKAKSYVPKMWDEFWAVKTNVTVDDSHVFRVYLSAPPTEDGPLLVLLHGGGYSALTWSHFTVSTSRGPWP